MCVTKNRVPWQMLLNIRTKVNTGVDEGLKERGRGGGVESEECEQIVFQKGTDKQKDQKKKQHSELVLKGDAQRDF